MVGGVHRGSKPNTACSRDKEPPPPEVSKFNRFGTNLQSRSPLPALDPETAGGSATGADAVPPLWLLTAMFFLKRAGPCERSAPLTGGLGSRRSGNLDCRILGGRGGRSSKSPLARTFSLETIALDGKPRNLLSALTGRHHLIIGLAVTLNPADPDFVV